MDKQKITKDDVGKIEDIFGKKPLDNTKPFKKEKADPEATTTPFKQPIKRNKLATPYKTKDKVVDMTLQTDWKDYVRKSASLGRERLFDGSFPLPAGYTHVSVVEKDGRYVLTVKNNGSDVTIVG